MNTRILKRTASRPIELLSHRRLLRRATFGASLLLLVVPMLFSDRLVAAEVNAAATNHIAIKAGHFLDVVRGEVLERQIILVEGDVIKSVGAEGSVAIPGGATILDLSQAWVLPGLIDCHTHITGQMEDYYADTFRKSPIDEAVLAHVFARRVSRLAGMSGRASSLT